MLDAPGLWAFDNRQAAALQKLRLLLGNLPSPQFALAGHEEECALAGVDGHLRGGNPLAHGPICLELAQRLSSLRSLAFQRGGKRLWWLRRRNRFLSPLLLLYQTGLDQLFPEGVHGASFHSNQLMRKR